jgi:hypothetical protein
MPLPAPPALALRTTDVTYPGSPEQMSAVRTDLRTLLDGRPMDAIVSVFELATNAVLHSHSR